jgi:hypothetical protein
VLTGCCEVGAHAAAVPVCCAEGTIGAIGIALGPGDSPLRPHELERLARAAAALGAMPELAPRG